MKLFFDEIVTANFLTKDVSEYLRKGINSFSTDQRNNRNFLSFLVDFEFSYVD